MGLEQDMTFVVVAVVEGVEIGDVGLQLGSMVVLLAGERGMEEGEQAIVYLFASWDEEVEEGGDDFGHFELEMVAC